MHSLRKSTKTRDYQLKAAVSVHSIIPHTKDGIKVWRAGKKWTDKHGNVKQAKKKVQSLGIATHEFHFDGKDVREAGVNIEEPGADVAVIYSKPGNWILIHGEDTYQILTWRDLANEGVYPVARKCQGRMVYLLRKLI